jgi:hypothetical protein
LGGGVTGGFPGSDVCGWFGINSLLFFLGHATKWHQRPLRFTQGNSPALSDAKGKNASETENSGAVGEMFTWGLDEAFSMMSTEENAHDKLYHLIFMHQS